MVECFLYGGGALAGRINTYYCLSMSRKITFWSLLVIGIAAVLWLISWLLVLSSNEPINSPLSRIPVWPVACTSRGCITSAGWLAVHRPVVGFAQATKQPVPSSRQTFTTAIRQHLVEHAFLQSPITLADARRYREEVLRITNSDQIKEIIGQPLEYYDEHAILPFLQQEALKQQRKVESTQELYSLLAKERIVIVLPFGYGWDKEKGETIKK